MIWVLVKRTKAFCVEHKHFNRVTVRRGAINRSSPDPYTLNIPSLQLDICTFENNFWLIAQKSI